MSTEDRFYDRPYDRMRLLHKGLIAFSIVGTVHAAWTGNLLALAWALLVFTMVLSSAIGWTQYFDLRLAVAAALSRVEVRSWDGGSDD